MRIAITRAVSASIAQCELTHLAREPIDVVRAVAQHDALEAMLERLGCTIVRLAAEPEMPDAVFVEDAAVVVDELAVLTRPGADSRRSEIGSVGAVLSRFRPLVGIEPPGTLDGGDVLRVGRRLFVGLSGRTNREGAGQLARHLAPHGYRVVEMSVAGCLHLKSAVTEAAGETLLVNPAWIDRGIFADFATIDVDPAESYAANVLRLGDVTLCAAAFPRTRERLERAGIATRMIDASELAKAEGALTCCSIVLEE